MAVIGTFDPITGLMTGPVNEKKLEFTRSGNGGLRVDDNINKMKYIINEDGSVKHLLGYKRVNMYDEECATLIAERVQKMFGPAHKYSSKYKFLAGERYIETYDEFVNERMFTGSIGRMRSGDIRKEEGVKVVLPNEDNTVVILGDMNCGVPVRFDTTSEFYYPIEFDGMDTYLFAYEEGGVYTYFVYNKWVTDDEDDESEKIIQIATAEEDMEEENFVKLVALGRMDSIDANDFIGTDLSMKLKDSSHGDYFTVECGNDEYIIFDDYEAVEKYAWDYVYDLWDEIGVDKELIERWRRNLGDDFFNTDQIKQVMQEDYESYVSDIESETYHAEHGNRLIDELIENGFIEDTDEYFEVDEDGELDYDQPKFDLEEKKELYVEQLCDNYDDPVQYMEDNFGPESLKDYIDYNKLTDMTLEADGIEVACGFSASEEYTDEDGNEAYVYQR